MTHWRRGKFRASVTLTGSWRRLIGEGRARENHASEGALRDFRNRNRLRLREAVRDPSCRSRCSLCKDNKNDCDGRRVRMTEAALAMLALLSALRKEHRTVLSRGPRPEKHIFHAQQFLPAGAACCLDRESVR